MSGCDRESAPNQKEADAAPKPAEPEQPSLVDSYEPRLDRIHSASVYEAVVSKSAAVSIAEERARKATIEGRQDIVERDALEDDTYTREEDLVLLGERDGWLIGFCYRYLVDINFPVVGKDGVGQAEYEEPQLTVLGQTFPLALADSDRSPDRAAEGEGEYAYFRTFGDHDAAVVFLPMSGAEVAHLGFEDPLAVVRHTLENRSAIFGLEFVLMSPRSMTFIQAQMKESQIAAFAAGMAVAALILIPLLGPSPAALPMALLEGNSRKLVAQALPIALVLGKDFLLQEDGFVAQHLGEDARVALLGVEMPIAGSEGHLMMAKFLASVVEADDAPGQFVEFGEKRGITRGQVFLPSHKMALGAELLSRGIARLDMGDQDVLREFPELVTAALSAVESKQALAARWADEDHDYVTQLRTLNKVVAG